MKNKIPTESELSDAAEHIYDIQLCTEHLQHLAHDALYFQDRQNHEFVAVCLHLDSPWHRMVDFVELDELLMKDSDQGFEPMSFGLVSSNFFDPLLEHLPSLATLLAEKPSEGMVKMVILNKAGAAIIEIKPEPVTGLH